MAVLAPFFAMVAPQVRWDIEAAAVTVGSEDSDTLHLLVIAAAAPTWPAFKSILLLRKCEVVDVGAYTRDLNAHPILRRVSFGASPAVAMAIFQICMGNVRP